MRVLHVHSGNLYGGVETLLLTLAGHRDFCPDVEPHFALCFEGRLSEELAAVSARTHQLGKVRARYPLSVWRARRMLADVIREHQIDVAICHSMWPHAIFAPVIRKAGLPMVLWSHGAYDGRHWTERWSRLSPPHLAIANSQFSARALRKIYPNVPTTVLHCMIRVSDWCRSDADRTFVRSEFQTPKEDVVIVQVGRMEPSKGHIVHLNALGMLSELPGWTCWQVGGGQRPCESRYVEKLKRTAFELGIEDRVRFVGERSDVRRILAAADIYCQPNVTPEGFGIAIVEALCARLPVVTAAIGGAIEIVDESCGQLLPAKDTQQLASLLRRLIQDGALRKNLGAAGPARARQLCDPATQLQQLHQTLVTLLDNHA